METAWNQGMLVDSGEESGRERMGLPFFCLLMCFFVEYVRPQAMVPFLGSLKPGLVTMVILLAAYLFSREKVKIPLQLWFMVVLVVQLAVLVPWAPNQHWAYRQTQDMAIRFLMVTLPMFTFLCTVKKLDRFLDWFLAFNAVIAFNAVLKQGMGSSSFLGDENDMCMTLLVVFPIAFFKFMEEKGALRRLLLLVLLIMLLVGMGRTFSRGGFLGLLAVMGWIWLRSNRKILALGLVVILAGLFYMVVPASYWKEIASIKTAASGAETGGARYYSWGLAIRMFEARPILGWGGQGFPYGAYQFQGEERFELKKAAVQRSLWGRQCHSVYFTVLSELGAVGTLLFLSLVLFIPREMHRLRKRMRGILGTGQAASLDDFDGGRADGDLKERPSPGTGPERDLARRVITIAQGLDGALIGYLASGVFLSAFYYPHFWNLLAMACALRMAVARDLPEPAPASRGESHV